MVVPKRGRPCRGFSLLILLVCCQNRTEQNRTQHNATQHNTTEHNIAEQNRTEQNRTEQNRTTTEMYSGQLLWYCNVSSPPAHFLWHIFPSAKTLPSIVCKCPDKNPLQEKLQVRWSPEKLKVTGAYLVVEIRLNKYLQLLTFWEENNFKIQLFIKFVHWVFYFFKSFAKKCRCNLLDRQTTWNSNWHNEPFWVQNIIKVYIP